MKGKLEARTRQLSPRWYQGRRPGTRDMHINRSAITDLVAVRPPKIPVSTARYRLYIFMSTSGNICTCRATVRSHERKNLCVTICLNGRKSHVNSGTYRLFEDESDHLSSATAC
ncbi:hypothetical protein Zmor_008319 [Zophobas morio]|uniref:Uncharacterized protein n=1 Tax=Zophobas morio TaxID=2755281 RepID=A0AA38IV87_9CUCU|nr:hypothetical protein Zmor_008319 [Zophobas morio]